MKRVLKISLLLLSFVVIAQTDKSAKKNDWYAVRDYITAWEQKESFKIKYSPKILEIIDNASTVMGIEIVSISIMADKAMMDTHANADGKIDSYGYTYKSSANTVTDNKALREELSKTLKEAFYQIYSDGVNEGKEVGLVIFSKKKAAAFYDIIR